VIETTGTADPVPLLQTLVDDPQVRPFLRVDGLITVVDGRNANGQLDAHFQCVKQVAVADRVLISKADLVGPADISALERRILALNPGVDIDTVLHGEVDPALILEAAPALREERPATVEAWLSEDAVRAAERARAQGGRCEGGHDHEGAAAHDHHHHHHHHHHHDDVGTFSVRHEAPVHPAGLKLWLDLLSVFLGPNLLRVKGLMNVDGTPVVVNLVQHVCHPPEELPVWPGASRESRIVFITRGVERAALESTLEALSFRPGAGLPPGRLDPAAYARFTSIMERFRAPGASIEP
jgi:G3E family GTPase